MLRRVLLGLSQEALGKLLGVTFQQVQKYERGVNRISAGRLFDISAVLDAPVTFFFIGLDDGPSSSSMATTDDPVVAERRQLVENYYRIIDVTQRRALCTLMRTLSDDAPEAAETVEEGD